MAAPPPVLPTSAPQEGLAAAGGRSPSHLRRSPAFRLQSELEFGHGIPSESSADGQPAFRHTLPSWPKSATWMWTHRWPQIPFVTWELCPGTIAAVSPPCSSPGFGESTGHLWC